MSIKVGPFNPLRILPGVEGTTSGVSLTNPLGIAPWIKDKQEEGIIQKLFNNKKAPEVEVAEEKTEQLKTIKSITLIAGVLGIVILLLLRRKRK